MLSMNKTIVSAVVRKPYVLAVFLFGIVGIVVVLYGGHTVYSSEPGIRSMVKGVVKGGVKPRVREIYGKDMPTIHPFKCIRTAKLRNVEKTYMMCIKPIEVDVWISAAFNNKGMWEPDAVELMIDLIHNYPGGTFLDLGANIGTYSAAVASTGYRAVALDPLDTNLAYIRSSVWLSGTEEYVRYIRNTVSDEFIRLYPFNADPSNEGAIYFVTKEKAETLDANKIGEPVDSTTFEDILSFIGSGPVIVKIDVEGYECKALMNYMANPEKILYVPYIFMEWHHMSRNHGGNCPELPSFIQGFVDSGYSPYDPTNISVKFSVEDEKKYHNVLWVHKDAVFDHK